MSHHALIVEDDPAISLLMETLLVRHGIEIETVVDGGAAIERLKKKRYSVVVLDLMIPRVSGFDVIAFVKENDLRIPIVVVSAASQRALAQVDQDVVTVVLAKPFDVDEFVTAVVKLCESAER